MVDWQADAFRPAMSAWLVIVLLLAVAAAAVMLYRLHGDWAGRWRRVVLAVLRVTALAALGWVLMGPTRLEQSVGGSASVPLWIVVDTSASMAERDVALRGEAEPMSRWEALRATWLSPGTQEALSEVADVRLFGFDEELQPVSRGDVDDGSPAGRQTRLFAAMQALMRQGAAAPPTVVLLSDGHDTSGQGQVMPLAAQAMAQWGGRVYVVPMGTERSTPDLAVQAWADADFLFEGQSTTIRATLHQRGMDGRSARVTLLHEGRPVQTREVSLDDQSAHVVTFRVTPEMDARQPVTVQGYEVRAALIDEEQGQPEAYLENNVRPVFVQVSRERIKVLLLEGEPYWDTRYLVRALQEDPQVELTAVFSLGRDRELVIADGDTGDDAPGRLTQAQLNDYDVVILGKWVDRLLPDASMLVAYVHQRGGALVMARGRAYDDDASSDTLSAISPVVWGRGAMADLSLRLTPQGEQSPLLSFEEIGPTEAVLTQLPGMIAATRIAQERAASLVLLRQAPADADAPPMAAIAYQHAGAGQVMAVLTDGLWRWALLPAALDRYGSVYHLFWSRAIRWLATGGEFLPGREVAMRLDRLTLEPDETIGLTVTTRFVDEDYRPLVHVTDPDGEVRTIEPQPTDGRRTHHRATFRPRKPGVYQFALNRPAQANQPPPPPITARVAVYERSTERLDPSAHPQVLAAIAQATGGETLGLHDSGRLIDHLESLGEARTSDVKATYDFTRPWALIVIVGCLGLEWLLRRRAGLL